MRDYTKWDNQPASVPAAYEALLRAAQIADTAPRGPTYVNLDAALQEAKIGPLPPLPDVARYRAPDPVLPDNELDRASRAACSRRRRIPVILAGRVGRSEAGWKARVALAEKLQARVFTDIKTPAAFPDRPSAARRRRRRRFPTTRARSCSREADVVLSLDWVDPAGTLKQAWGDEPIGARSSTSRPTRIRIAAGAWTTRACRRSDVYMMCEPDAGGAAPPRSGEARVQRP